ncbi:Stage IV sporulation protein A [Koleobacter methoxysyntrophicus]|uniref:Stage IV sporulation protein A n=1 Tax=Koleobacter methoxysyntrophicus TaxID=2751313 RepID=A0A8A0RMY4_9FIRM|nr:stage IV sporulation protein A [Koleobacter methoxysyntrophicus]MDI3540726.1 stage sporulation protein [Thermosediminibacterales bacterium]QSQ09761.1 Stage IV sporulation protein A [Koleobacter methoxysyntrophicus]
MERFDLLKDIAERTNGDIYIGVVGPVRSGKSTFIKKFMEKIVLPHIENVHDKNRTKDELPQSGAGKTITTAEPKFIPNEAVELKIKDNIKFRVRIVDCVGYTVKGALGYEDENGPRMVSTPWFDKPIPFQEAAELGTRKVISDHSTIGLVVTTDGSITEIPRESYKEPEERIIAELKELDKPFIVILNTTMPREEKTKELKQEMEQKYQVPVIPADCSDLDQDDIYTILQEVLYEFFVKEININMPKWINALEEDYWLKKSFLNAVKEISNTINKLRDIEKAVMAFNEYDFVDKAVLEEMDLGTGVANIKIEPKEGLFYKILSETSGFEITGDDQLIRLMKELSIAKREYDKIAGALEKVKDTGYGIVPPFLEEMVLEEPEIIRHGSKFGVKLKASAPSIHMIKADIQTEVSPIVGTEKQSEELVNYLLNEFESDPKKIWESNIFGKSLHDLVREGIQNKLNHMPETAQMKLQETLQRIINEGSGGLICIIL